MILALWTLAALAAGPCDLETVDPGGLQARWATCGEGCEALETPDRAMPPLGVRVDPDSGRVGAALVSEDQTLDFVVIEPDGTVASRVRMGAGFPEQCVARTSGVTADALLVHVREGERDTLIRVRDGAPPERIFVEDGPRHWDFTLGEGRVLGLTTPGPELHEIVSPHESVPLWAASQGAVAGRPSVHDGRVAFSVAGPQGPEVVALAGSTAKRWPGGVDAGADASHVVWTDPDAGTVMATDGQSVPVPLTAAPELHTGVLAWTVGGGWAGRPETRDRIVVVPLAGGTARRFAGSWHDVAAVARATLWAIPTEGGVRRLALAP